MEASGGTVAGKEGTAPTANKHNRGIIKAKRILEGGYYKSFYPFKFLKEEDGDFIFTSSKNNDNWFKVRLDGEVTCYEPPTQKKKF